MQNLILFALILFAYPLVSWGAVEGQWTYIIENGGATITTSTATGAVTIPSVLGGYAVKKVGSNGPPIFGYPNSFGLYTATQYTDNFTAGRNDVINSPNSNGLYTANQMQAMAIGDLVLTKDVNGDFVLNYDIEQSEDLQTWTRYQALSQTLTGLPAEKAFVRIKAKQ